MQVERNEFIFKAVGYQGLGRHASLQQAADLVDHPLLQARLQPRIDAGVADFAGDEGADEVGARDGIGTAVRATFHPRRAKGRAVSRKGTPVPALPVRRQSDGLYRCLAQRLPVPKIVSGRYRIDIEAGAATEDGHLAAGADISKSSAEILNEIVRVILRARVAHINNMVRDVAVLRQILAGADVHPPVNLARIRRDNLRRKAKSR